MSLTLVSPLFSFRFEELIELGHYSVPEMRLHGIYCISCDRTEQIYIGSAASRWGISGRFDCHMRRLKEGKHHSWILQRDFKRHGIESFNFHIIEFCKPQDAVAREQIYLDLTSASDPQTSYNICAIAQNCYGIQQTNETIRKRSESLKLTYLKRPMTEETKRKISEAQKGRKIGAMKKETRQKISEAHKKREIPEKQIQHVRQLGLASKGKKFSDELRAKLSESHKGYIMPDSQKENLRKALLGREITQEARAKVRAKKGGKYLVINPNGQQQEIISLRYFCQQNGLCQGHMSEVATGKRNHHKGWTCKRID